MLETNSKQSNQKSVSMKILPFDFWLYSNPVVLFTHGKVGKRAEAGQWTLEIQKLLNGIEKSVSALENIMNQSEKGQKLYLEDKEIKIPEEEKYWIALYTVDNAILRIYACIDKIAQMCRCYFEHNNNGGKLTIVRKCGCSEEMDEYNCNFGALVNSLNSTQEKEKNQRTKTITSSLNKLNNNKSIHELRKYRNTFTHRKHTTDQSAGLDPTVGVEEQEDGTTKTTFSFGREIPTVNWFRVEIIEANNAITDFLSDIGETIFPKDFEIKLKKNEVN